VGITRRRDAGADVQELPDPRLDREEPHYPAQECPVRAAHANHVRVSLQDLLADGPVSGKVVLPADQVVIHPGLVGNADINVRRLVAIVGNHTRKEAV
jgi:hypothetical protein